MVSSEVKTRRWLPPKIWHAEHREFGSLNFVYASAQSGRLACIKVGGRVLIASDALELRWTQWCGQLRGRVKRESATSQTSTSCGSAPSFL